VRAVGDGVVDYRGHHHHRHIRAFALDLRQRLKAVETGHVVIEKHQAEIAAAQLIKRGNTFRRFVDIQFEMAGR